MKSQFNTPSKKNYRDIIIVFGAILVYVVGFILLYPYLKEIVMVFFFIPVVVTTFLEGWWWSMVVGLLAIPLNILLVIISPYSLSDINFNFWAIHLALLFVSMAIGHLSFTRLSLKKTLAIQEESLRELQIREERYNTLFNQSNDAIYIMLPNGILIDVNDRGANLLGYTRDEMIGLAKESFIVPEELDNAAERLARASQGELMPVYERQLLHKNGDVIPVEINAAPVVGLDRSVVCIQSIVRDITAHKHTESRLRYIATHDQLTSLPNRTLFYDRLDHAIQIARRQGNRLAVFFLDLDGFKDINDRYGHPVGDIFLQLIAERLRNFVRESDTVARMSGDEFTFILENISSEEDATQAAGRILKAISEPLQIEKRILPITGSLGISFFPEHGTKPDILIQHADQAMYKAKKNGKNQLVVFSQQEPTAGQKNQV